MNPFADASGIAPSDVPVIETRGVVRVLGDKVKTTVLHGIDLAVREGEFVALTGQSGSGKSTLLYIIGALDMPTSGEVFIDGIDATRLDDNGRAALRNEKLGFVFQFHFLLPEFSVLENVCLPMLRRGISDDEAEKKALETLAVLGLQPLIKRKPGELSGGQQQRVSIARALANEPKVLLADEPTGNLDSDNGRIVMDLFERLNTQRGLTIVMVTHDPHFAARASRQITMSDGKIVADEYLR